MYKTYEVYVVNPYGSDVVNCDTLDEAKKEAENWAKQINYKYDVVVSEIVSTESYRVKRKEIKNNGKS